MALAVRKSLSALVLVLVVTLIAANRQAEAAAPPIPAEIQTALQDRNYEGAIAAIQEQLKQKDAPADYLLYLLGRAQHLLQRYEEAVATFDRLVEQHPESPWVRRARFAKAVSLARKGDYQGAELIYRSEAEFLFSLARKEEIADIYLEFAEAYFKPTDEQQKPDYALALEFFGRALQVGPQPETRRQVELKIAQCRYELGQHDEAAVAYQQFIKQHPDHPLQVEARFRLGQTYLAQQNLVEARRTWQDLLDLYKTSDSPRLAETRFEMSRTYNIPQPENAEQLSLGVAALQAFVRQHPEHKLASLAHLRIAESYQHQGRHQDAVAAARRLLDDARYAGKEEIPRARFLLGHSLRMQGKFDEALASFREFLTQHPTDAAWSDVQRAIIDTEYMEAEATGKDKQYEPARKLWQEFLTRHPLDQRNPTILLLLGRMNFDQKQWDAAITDWRRLVSKYPNTEESSQAQYLIALTLEEKLGKLDESLKEYRKLTWGGRAAHAQARIARLTSKSLSVATERVFRGGETPQLKLVTRNIESVHVRIYQVDLETYFRKMHLAQGIEQLDIALIDPDRAFDYPVPEYQQYQQLEHQVDVPLGPAAAGNDPAAAGNDPAAAGNDPAAAGNDPTAAGKAPVAGVMAVTVGSKTLETTTLVVQSDMDLIVKSSRDELFVFAENLRTGKPWPAAKLLISDGSKVFAEGVTGDDGVFRGEFEELKTATDVRVFAISEQHTASNVVGLNGVGVAQGLTAKGYIYSDRPAYRPGQMVHVRGIIRHVAGDAYKIEAGKKYQLEVRDNRNRLVHADPVSLNGFGSFHAHFLLPAVSPQGEYRIALSDQDQENYQGTFQVQEYQPQTIRLDVDTPRRVYYRGEDIEGKIRVTYYYGAPVRGRDVRYRLANGRVFTAKTDEKGEIGFVLPTREFRESQALPLLVELPDQALQGGTVFQLATQGFSLTTSLVRSTFLAGETFELTVQANDAEGKPVAQSLELHVLKQTSIDGKVGEVEVESRELKTGDDGLVRQTLQLKEGGNYILRLVGIDRFENPVTTQTTVNISDDKDQVRLRILADRHTFQAGDVAQLKVHWREKPALALVTFQGARILDYRLVVLQTGENALQVPMTAKLAPNFDLTVSVMTDAVGKQPDDQGVDQADVPTPRRFHEASSPFSVQRELNVKVQIQRKDGAGGAPRPGEDVEVVVTTTDPQGKPVSAELSLALIEKSLLDRFGANVPAIQEFFRNANRQSAVRTTSSIEFQYRPRTQNINPLLLAEAERREVELEEASRLETLAATGAMGGGDMGSGSRSGYANFGAVTLDTEALGEEVVNARELRNSERRMGRAQQFTDAFNSPDGGQLMLGGLTVQQTQQVHQGQWDFNGNANGTHNDTFSYYLGFAERGSTASMRFGPRLLLSEATVGNNWAMLSGETPVLQKDGIWFNVNTKNMPEAQVTALLRELATQDAILLGNLRPHETAYWNPAVTTDEQGQATVSFTLPEKSTAWTLLTKGITLETLAGEQSNELVVSKDLFGQLKLPAALTDGDRAELGVSVHNQAMETGTISVTLKVTIGDKTTSIRKSLDVDAKGIHELSIPQAIELPAQARQGAAPGAMAEFELTVEAGDRRDVVRRVVPVLPYGMPIFALAGGTAQGDVGAVVEPPPSMPLTSPRLQILIGPSVEHSLLDAVLGSPTWCQAEGARLTSGVDSAAADLMASLALQKLMATSRDASVPQAESLDSRIRSTVSTLVSVQNDDGGWNWTGHQAASDRYASARVVWALSLAKSAGYRVADETHAQGINYLKSQIAEAAVADFETKAILLQALAAAGQGDFPLANQLYRNRPSLSAAGLAHLALAFADMDRRQTAAELLDLLAQRKLDAVEVSKLSWNQSGTELRALYALALDQVAPADARLAEQIDWLMSHRTGHRWSPDKATGPAMLAVCRWFGRTRFESDKYELTIYVNDLLAQKLAVDKDTRTQTLDIPTELLREGKQRVRLEINGRGRFTYQCVLGGFVAGDKLKSTTTDWEVTRYVEPAPREFDGHEVARGFDVLQGTYQSFRNELRQLPVGQRGHVTLRVVRNRAPASRAGEELEYLVVTEPLPAGTTVVENSLKGGFERFELRPGAITFYVGSRRAVEQISYDIHGFVSGTYRAAPTLVRNAYQQDQIAVAKPAALEVLPLGAESGDDYRLTPRELYLLGRLHFERHEYAQSAEHLRKLTNDWNLNPDVYKEAVRMLLDLHLELGPPAEVVRYFEIVIEKYADLEIPFDKLLKIGDAYDKMAEYERSYLVFRATVEASFLKESQVAGFLAGQDKFLRSVDVTNELLQEYPPEPYVAAASYALAQRVYAKAPEAAIDVSLREKKLTRVDLIRQAWQMLDSFLTEYPEDPASDEASFSLANALLDLELYEQTIQSCGRYAERYPNSDFLDSYWYMIGYCHFARGEHKAALQMCNKVAETMRMDRASGREVESQNKWRAIYILGQVHHSLGEAEQAIGEYRRVEDRFADARQAIEYFVRKDISLPEVTTFQPGQAAKVPLEFRNVAQCQATVYRIDLMKFSLLRRTLGGITKINLSGIRPHHEATIPLGDGRDFRDRRKELDLPLKEAGAYLIVCRADDLHATGLVLVSPLELEVQEDATSGRVRTTVRNKADNRYQHDVHVKVIGSRNPDFVSGETDLRGVFVSDGILGTSMVIAQVDDNYAFYRGQQQLGPPPAPAQQTIQLPQAAVASEDAEAGTGKSELLRGLKAGNYDIQQKQQKQLDSLYQNSIDQGIPSSFGGGLFK